MANSTSSNTTRYHRVPNIDATRASIDEQDQDEMDASLSLLDPLRDNTYDARALLSPPPPKKSFTFSYHPTIFFRLIAICVLCPSFVLFVLSNKDLPHVTGATILTCLVMVRNILVVLHHFLFSRLRIRFSVEFRNRGPRTKREKSEASAWVVWGLGHVLFDFMLLSVLLITIIIAQTGRVWYWHSHPGHVRTACVLSYIGFAFYLFAIVDLGKPSNITANGGIIFDYGKRKEAGPDFSPPVYRDVEAAGGLGPENRKSGADSPVII